MPDEPENLILHYLRRIDNKVDRFIERMSAIEARMSAVEIHIGQLGIGIGLVNQRLDRIGQHLVLERIERRLDSIEKGNQP